MQTKENTYAEKSQETCRLEIYKPSLSGLGRGLVCVISGAGSVEGSLGRGNSIGEDTEVGKNVVCLGEIKVQHACPRVAKGGLAQ